jgi:hypothetical protein
METLRRNPEPKQRMRFTNKLTLAALTVIAIGGAGCSISTEPHVLSATVLEVQYANFAWTPTYRGFVIDSTGAIYSYDLGGKQWTVADPDHPTTAELAAKYDSDRKLVKSLSASERAELFDLAARSQTGSVSTPVNRCADAGALTYTVYSSAEGEPTRRVLLRAEGDLIAENTASAAKTLAAKLAALALIQPISGCQP